MRRCPTGNNQSSPTAGCDTLLTSGLATYQTIENLLNNGYRADDKINQKQSEGAENVMSNFGLREILANLSLTCLAVNRIFIILLSRRSWLQIHRPEQRLWKLT